ncbi:MAG: hypothetical protein J6X97_06585 [Lachnospiraceae bacterium]|nr:hypothetical protein [Lachnospiraceae bacterium]
MNELKENSKYGLNRGNLKMIALFCMTLDHIAAIVLIAWLHTLTKGSVAYACCMDLIIFLRLIGRLAFPMFCYFIVEGLLHTGNIYKYAFRLFLLALISEIPFDFSHSNRLFDFSNQNVFWTLLLGLVAIYCIDGIYRKFKLKRAVRYLLVFGITLLASLVAYSLKSDYGAFGISTIVIVYLVEREEVFFTPVINGMVLFIYYFVITNTDEINLGEFEKFSKIAIAIYLIFVLVVSTFALCLAVFIKDRNQRKMYAACVTLSSMSPDEMAALANVFLMKYYNGEKGKKIGWLFYLYYPLHLAVLAGVCKLLKLY